MDYGPRRESWHDDSGFCGSGGAGPSWRILGGNAMPAGHEELAGATAHGRVRGEAQVVLPDGRLLQAVEVAQDVPPFGRDPSLGAALQELLA